MNPIQESMTEIIGLVAVFVFSGLAYLWARSLG